eukprot:m.23062 g.23062  ORF g.23062 m.23062 type:complete len:1500 (-) comp7463_c0_seq1:80-4579(-)
MMKHTRCCFLFVVLFTSSIQSVPGEEVVIDGSHLNENYNENVRITGPVTVTKCEIQGDLIIDTLGVLTHKITNNPANSMDLTVTGKLTVLGTITADGKSSWEVTNRVGHTKDSCFAAYGGRTSLDSSCKGNVENPTELGTASISRTSYYYYSSKKCYKDTAVHPSYYGGGLIKLTVGSLHLDGRIEARGICAGSGGTVNIKVNGNPVNGTGLIDVGVITATGCSETGKEVRASGGRASIYGYSSISNEILANSRMEGYNAAPGTFFFREADTPTGNLIVRSSKFQEGMYTCALQSTSLQTLEISNSNVELGKSIKLIANGRANVRFINDEIILLNNPTKDFSMEGANLKVEGDVDFVGTVQLNSLTVFGSLKSSGDLNVKDKVHIMGDLTIFRNAKMPKETTVNGSLWIVHDASMEASKITVGKDMKIEGELTHKLTNDKKESLDVSIEGVLEIAEFGKVSADLKSSLTGYGLCHGGEGYNCYSNSGRGNALHPDELGISQTSSPKNAGGRIKIKASSAQLDGTLSARGSCGGTGGSVHLFVTRGGVMGTGTVDVSAAECAADSHVWFYVSGGGRIAIHGYTKISSDIIRFAKADGSFLATSDNYNGGAGTIYVRHRSQVKGNLFVRSPRRTTEKTYVGATAHFCNVTVQKANPDYLRFCEDCVMIDGTGTETCPAKSDCAGSCVAPSSSNMCSLFGREVNQWYDEATGFCMPCTGGFLCRNSMRYACAEDQYKANEDATQCSNCIAGKSTYGKNQQLGEESCICVPGTYGPACKPCESGYKCNNGTKEICPVNTYQPEKGQSQCFPCPIGSSTMSGGAVSIDSCACSKGYFEADDIVGFKCSRCPVGHSCDGKEKIPCIPNWYADRPGLHACLQCPSGTSTRGGFGTTSKDDCICLAGTFHQDGSCEQCQKGFECNEGKKKICPVGTYSDTTLLPACRKCPVASSNSKKGSQSANECLCDPGTYRTYTLSPFLCKQCPIGTYNNVRGSTCKPCGSMAITENLGANSSSQCKCPRGWYKELSALSQEIQCKICPRGVSCKDGLATPCGTNGENTIASQQGTSECLACPLHSTSALNATVCTCDDGYYASIVNNKKTCLACPYGNKCTQEVRIPCGASLFQDEKAQGRCKPCPSGLSHNASEAISVDACVQDSETFVTKTPSSVMISTSSTLRVKTTTEDKDHGLNEDENGEGSSSSSPSSSIRVVGIVVGILAGLLLLGLLAVYVRRRKAAQISRAKPNLVGNPSWNTVYNGEAPMETDLHSVAPYNSPNRTVPVYADAKANKHKQQKNKNSIPSVPSESLYRNQPWLYGKLDRKAAEAMLRKDPSAVKGIFLVRKSGNKPGFVISVAIQIDPWKFEHYVVLYNEGLGGFTIDNKPFSVKLQTIEQVVEHLKETTDNGKTGARLVNAGGAYQTLQFNDDGYNSVTLGSLKIAENSKNKQYHTVSRDDLTLAQRNMQFQGGYSTLRSATNELKLSQAEYDISTSPSYKHHYDLVEMDEFV